MKLDNVFVLQMSQELALGDQVRGTLVECLGTRHDGVFEILDGISIIIAFVLGGQDYFVDVVEASFSKKRADLNIVPCDLWNFVTW